MSRNKITIEFASEKQKDAVVQILGIHGFTIESYVLECIACEFGVTDL